jgi:hypothetical protein
MSEFTPISPKFALAPPKIAPATSEFSSASPKFALAPPKIVPSTSECSPVAPEVALTSARFDPAMSRFVAAFEVVLIASGLALSGMICAAAGC